MIFSGKWPKWVEVLKKSYVYIGRSKGVTRGVSSSLGPVSFIFMHFLAKIQQNNRFLRKFTGWHPRLVNPGSAAGVDHRNSFIAVMNFGSATCKFFFWRKYLPFATVVAERLCCHRCLSVHRGEVYTPLPGRHPLPEMATAAEGTHPTGMHSCSEFFVE